jgi:hypothetical protein
VGLTHFEAILFFAAVVSTAFAFHSRQAPRERAFYALKSFLLFVGSAILIGWLMLPISR